MLLNKHCNNHCPFVHFIWEKCKNSSKGIFVEWNNMNYQEEYQIAVIFFKTARRLLFIMSNMLGRLTEMLIFAQRYSHKSLYLVGFNKEDTLFPHCSPRPSQENVPIWTSCFENKNVKPPRTIAVVPGKKQSAKKQKKQTGGLVQNPIKTWLNQAKNKPRSLFLLTVLWLAFKLFSQCICKSSIASMFQSLNQRTFQNIKNNNKEISNSSCPYFLLGELKEFLKRIA